MSKKHQNLRTQLRTAVFTAFTEHTDKRTLRRDEKKGKVFSYGSKYQLLDRASDFGHFAAGMGIRQISELTPAIATAYLDSKAKTCTQTTVDEYRSELRKLGALCGVDLACDRVLADRPADQHRGAQSVISKEDFNALLRYAEEHPSGSGVCILLESEIGVRVSDMAYGIQITGDKLHIRCKNGKYLDRPITSRVREIMDSEAFQRLIDGDKVRAPKDNSINKYILRTERKLGLEEHSFHDLRRRIAQDRYDMLRLSGIGRSDALKAVSLWLNHGEGREKMVLKSYIADAW